MIDYTVRFLKRFIVLVPGIIIAYVSINTIFPAFDKRFPLAIAIFFTYVLGAYLLIPLLIRIGRIFLPARHLPMYCVTPDGFASDPLNVGVIATRAELITAMATAGWHVADSHSIRHVFRQFVTALLNQPYETAPMSYLYLFGRRQDIGFEIPLEGTRGQRHHVRFWAASYEESTQMSVKKLRWHDRNSVRKNKDLLWLGAASRDVGFAVIRHNVQITHMIDANTNVERQLIVDGLRQANLIKNVQTIRLRKPYWLMNRALGGQLHTDGQLAVVTLRSTARTK
jgi:hypothetical protein